MGDVLTGLTHFADGVAATFGRNAATPSTN
jgi:hypothetical protein